MTGAGPTSQVAASIQAIVAAAGPYVPALLAQVEGRLEALATGHGPILDDIARTGYDGVQLGIGFPEGDAIKSRSAGRFREDPLATGRL